MKILFIAIAFGSIVFTANSTPPLKAYLTYASFNIPSKEPYFETYLSVIGSSVKFIKNKNGKLQGEVDIAVNFTIDGIIKNSLKYALNSPEISDTLNGYPNFLDQHRYSLPNGKYNLEISMTDKNNPAEKPFVSTLPVEINFPDDNVSISDIQLLESYGKTTSPSIITKSGYDLVPYVSTFFPENIKTLKFYSEIYNAKKIFGEGQKMLITYSIETYLTNTSLSSYSAFSKQPANDVNILLSEFNIEALPSGNYKLKIEARDKENKVVAEQSCLFQRKNKQEQESYSFEDLKSINVANTFVSRYKNADSLYGFVRCLRPISSAAEIQYSENQLKRKNLEDLRQYFYNFWRTRNATQPETAWTEYYKEVQKVNVEYRTFGMKGYDTDRGRVYLQYGAPNTLSKYEAEPSSYPYEIWEYDLLVDKTKIVDNPNNKQTNKRFIFYNPDLVSNNYKLIHSDAIGEVHNSRWQLLLQERNTQSNNPDEEKAPEHFGGNADDNFNHPK